MTDSFYTIKIQFSRSFMLSFLKIFNKSKIGANLQFRELSVIKLQKPCANNDFCNERKKQNRYLMQICEIVRSTLL